MRNRGLFTVWAFGRYRLARRVRQKLLQRKSLIFAGKPIGSFAESALVVGDIIHLGQPGFLFHTFRGFRQTRGHGKRGNMVMASHHPGREIDIARVRLK